MRVSHLMCAACFDPQCQKFKYLARMATASVITKQLFPTGSSVPHDPPRAGRSCHPSAD